MCKQSRNGVLVVLFACLGAAHLLGDDKADEAQRQLHLARTKQIAGLFEIRPKLEANAPVARLGASPLLRYNDSTRRLSESTLWLWTEREIPIALMAIESYPNQDKTPPWLYEIVSLSSTRIKVARSKAWQWQAARPGMTRTPLPKAAVPGDQPAQRLIQMRQLRSRFAAHETATIGGRIELRALAAPLYRYADAETGIIDGAIFSYANGTNPEVLLLLEAQRGTGTSPATWTYGFAQMTGAAVSASVDGKDVWNQKEADPPASRDAYVNGWLTDDEVDGK